MTDPKLAPFEGPAVFLAVVVGVLVAVDLWQKWRRR